MMMKGKGLHMITFLLLVVGGLNWLVVGLFGYDLVGLIFGGMSSWLSRIIYILVGLSAVYELVVHKKCCNTCSAGAGKDGGSSMPGTGGGMSGNTPPPMV
jgi:uncharacterized protein